MIDIKLVRQELLQMVSTLSDEEINQFTGENQWNIAQILEHLYLLERAIAVQLRHGYHEESIEKKKIDLVLDRSIKINAPSALEPKSDYQTLEHLKMRLEKSRQQLTEIVELLGPEQLNQKALPHPVFGLLTLQQWVEFVGYHEKRHIEQIKENIEKLVIDAKSQG